MNHKNHKLPIGVFDSGVGGLTVLQAMMQALPDESYLYLGDTARLFYGSKSPDTIAKYSLQATDFLLSRGVKCLVVACNTASTLGLQAVMKAYPELPIIGVVEPGAQAACAASASGHIGVIATEATVKAKGYHNAIAKLRPEAKIFSQSCRMFVALAEEGWLDDPITDAVANRYLGLMLEQPEAKDIDCLVLGCTHFPVLYPSIKRTVGDRIKIIDSAQTTAEAVAKTLDQKRLFNNGNNRKLQFLVTDAPEQFAAVAKRFLGLDVSIDQVELVDIVNSK